MQDKPKSILRRIGLYLSQSRFYTTSIIIHLVLVGALGGVVLVRERQENSSFEATLSAPESAFLNEADAVDTESSEEQNEFEQAESAAVAAPSMSQSTIQSLTAAQTWTAVSTVDQMTFGNTLSATKFLAAGEGASSAPRQTTGGRIGAAGSKMTGTLFGVKVEATKLGVILDVSGSAHPHLVAALDQIQKGYENATIFLYPGCGMSAKATPNEYRVEKPHAMRDKFERMANTPTIYGTLAMWSRNYPNDQPRIKKLLQSSDVYIMDTDSKTTCMVGCQFAFERLMEDKVDAIYWFADFGDIVDEGVAKEIAKQLRAQQIKVIAYNFAGNSLSPGAEIIVDKTGGKASFAQSKQGKH